ncbi:hypothetical protein MUN81_07900 [Hymenobacter sp. 5317J-9]|uniref:hypothetical protein n=1 Tax=Hymenobacter sp. 5317J-9 TaxID=2932250 RepID=UPI001FD6EA21|nr:hypothetical protein [Hymenobacter sp. 5317J-9]UOQ99411.1 hypothetical protein MUN81_07900 [Hymenobacter sp. 5317J-9]
MEAPAPEPQPGSTAALAAQLFAQKPEAELLYLAQNAARYPPAVGAAAVAELKRRGLLPEAAAPAPPPRPRSPKPGASCWASCCGACSFRRGASWPRRCCSTPRCSFSG